MTHQIHCNAAKSLNLALQHRRAALRFILPLCALLFAGTVACSSDPVAILADSGTSADANTSVDAGARDSGTVPALPYDRRSSFYSAEDRSTRGAGVSIDFLENGDFVTSGLQMGNFRASDESTSTGLEGWASITASFSTDLESRWVTVRESNLGVPTTPSAEPQVTIGNRTFLYERYGSPREIARLAATGAVDASWTPALAAEDPMSTISDLVRDGDALVAHVFFQSPRSIGGEMVEGRQLVWLDQDLEPLQAVALATRGQLFSDASGGVVFVARNMDDMFQLSHYDRSGAGTTVDLVPGPDGSGRSIAALDVTSDRIVFAGHFAEGPHSADPSSPNETANDTLDVFVTVLDRSGNLVFSDSFGGTDFVSTDRLIALATDPITNRVAIVANIPRPATGLFDGIDVETGGLATDLYTLVFLADGTVSRAFRVGALGQSPRNAVGGATFSGGALWTAVSEWTGGGGSNIHHGLTVRRFPL